MAAKLELDYFETSAATGRGVEEMFAAIATKIKRRVVDGKDSDMASSPSFALQSSDGREGCCA